MNRFLTRVTLAFGGAIMAIGVYRDYLPLCICGSTLWLCAWLSVLEHVRAERRRKY